MLFHDILRNIHSLTICICPKGRKNGNFMSTTLRKPPFFLYYVHKYKLKSRGISTNDFSVKEARFNLKLAECMQKTCGNLNTQLHKNQSYALICDFYWRLSHMGYTHEVVVIYIVLRCNESQLYSQC